MSEKSRQREKERERERERYVIQIVYRFHFENLFYNYNEAMEIADDSNNTYRKRIAFFIHAHQKALR